MNARWQTGRIDSDYNGAYAIAEVEESTALHPLLRGNQVKADIEIELILGIYITEKNN